MKKTKAVKIEQTVAQLLEAAVAEGFNHILDLDEKQSGKKVFRAAVGHGCHDAGPLFIDRDALGQWLSTLLARTLQVVNEQSAKNLGVAQVAYKKVLDKLTKTTKDGAIRRLKEDLQTQCDRVEFAEKVLQSDFTAIEVALIDISMHCARGLHTHDGKLVHGGSKLRLFCFPEGGSDIGFIPYIYSNSTASERQISAGFAHQQDAIKAALIFYAIFSFEGVITSFAQLLRSKDILTVRAFLQAGVSIETIFKLQDIFSQTGEKIELADSTIPQQQWPDESGQGYTSLQAVPSLGVYAALTRAKREWREDAYLPAIQTQVGSGQAQNISVFAISTSGYLTLWKCEPPVPPSNDASSLLRQCWSGSLIASRSAPSRFRDKEFEQNIALRPASQREKFMAGYAKSHTFKALKNLNRARDLFDAGNEKWIEAIAKLNEYERNFILGEKPSKEQVEALGKRVRLRLPIPSLTVHQKEDVDVYMGFVKSSIKTAC